MKFETSLPIDSVLPDLCAVLAAEPNAVLIAPPGAGKTTRVPLALLDQPWRGDGTILMLSPRRLAARAAAQRMADTLGEPVGKTVGYRMRLDTKVSAATHIEVITEALLTRRILEDPELNGVAAIIFDEFHERSLDGDVGLALALDVQSAFRPDLRILPMSATLDVGRISDLLASAPILQSEGRVFPIEMVYAGRDPNAPIERQIVPVILQALREQTGSLLVFLPGQAEINRVARALEDSKLPATISLHPLIGALDIQDQRAAIAPTEQGKRKIVLATSIAETSLTIEGVRVVIDSGLSRRSAFDPNAAINSLVTTRASLASATQRAGRAGRLAPGVCYRLWQEAENRSLIAFDPPEMLSADMAPLVLTLAAWGVHNPATLRWLDPPPPGPWKQAAALLQSFGALDETGGLTAHGKTIAQLPMHPRIAHMLAASAKSGFALLAGELAALLSEPGFGGRETDMRTRIETLRRDSSARGKTLRTLARSWAHSVGGAAEIISVENTGAVLALGFPDRVAKARGSRGAFLMRNGRGVIIPETEALAREPWLVVTDASGTADRARILSAAPISWPEIEEFFADDLTTEIEHRETGNQGNVQFFEITRLGAINVREKNIQNPPAETIHGAWIAHIKRRGLSTIGWSENHQDWQDRILFLREYDDSWPEVSQALLIDTVEDWLKPFFSGKSKITEVSSEDVQHALMNLLSPDQQRSLNKLAPARLETPAGSSHKIDYAAHGGPAVHCRVQEVFGLTNHPMVGAQALTLVLLSPGHKPIQTTKDLPGFWRGSWAAVKSEMRGRYPRHAWPDDPSVATATTRAKPRGT